jgi:hypothetical protein
MKGYLTIEASLIIPFVLCTYVFLMFTSFFLYNKCVLNQDTYIKCFRASVFTYWEEGYGEISYADLARRNAGKAREYVEKTDHFTKYPFFKLESEETSVFQWGILTSDVFVKVHVEGTVQSFLRKDYQVKINAVSLITNPVSNIRSARRNEKNAGD